MRKNISYCHPSFSLENVKGSSNYKTIKSGRSLDLAYQLGAMTIEGLTPPFLLVSSARQSLTRFGHRFVTLAVRRYSLACKLTNA